MNCKKCKLTKLQFQNYLNTNYFIFNFQTFDLLLMYVFGVYGLRRVCRSPFPTRPKFRHVGQCRRHPRNPELIAPADHGSTLHTCDEAFRKGYAVRPSIRFLPIRTAKPLDLLMEVDVGDGPSERWRAPATKLSTSLRLCRLICFGYAA